MRSFIGSESIVEAIYETICRIERDGGDSDDQETWDRYYAGFKVMADDTIPDGEIHMKDANGDTVGKIINADLNEAD